MIASCFLGMDLRLIKSNPLLSQILMQGEAGKSVKVWFSKKKKTIPATNFF
jgi:hypothetical protein